MFKGCFPAAVLSSQDSNVTQLTQDLAKILGLKIRKAYIRSKVCIKLFFIS